jgi:hypothetical protein
LERQPHLTATSAYDITWYDAAVGGNALGTGATYVTPQLFASTPYYVGAQAGIQESAGKPTYIGTDNTSGNAWGLVFDVVSSDIVIETVDVYSVGAGGSITVELRNSSGVLLQSVGPFSYPPGSTGSPVTVTLPLNLSVPVGTGYRLQSAAMTGNLIREFAANNNYPYTSGSGNVIVQSGFITNPGSTTYYWFYNWQVASGSGCESDRAEVWANVIIPSCIPVIAVDVDNVTSSTADLTWAPAATETAWQIELGVSGFTPTGTPTHFASSIPYIGLTGLMNNTAYQFYMRSDCGSEYSQWWGPFSFTTLLCDPIDKCNHTFVLLDSYGDGWNGATMQVKQGGVVVATLGTTFTTDSIFTEIVSLCDGIAFEVIWNNAGTFAFRSRIADFRRLFWTTDL